MVAQTVKNLPAMQETQTRSLGWKKPPGEGNGNLLRYSWLENPIDREAWQTTVHGVAKELDMTEGLNNNRMKNSQSHRAEEECWA